MQHLLVSETWLLRARKGVRSYEEKVPEWMRTAAVVEKMAKGS